MIDAPSPNFNARAAGIPLAFLVVHYTGMEDAAGALARLRDPAAEVSAHYMIDEDGTVYRLVAEENRAWHAGKSWWRGQTDMNSASIGVELVNPGHAFGYRAFPAPQIEAFITLALGILTRHPGIAPDRGVVAHSDIAPCRRQDPGELFPWQKLAQRGLGVWPEVASGENAEETLAETLAAIGYDTGALPEAILAFQRRFYPEALARADEAGTAARARAVRRLIGA